MLDRTRFGFELKASGESPTAATAGGVDARRMVVVALLLSGAAAGLVGLPELLGRDYAYTLTSPQGYGFTGIAIALLGRNHPVGIALGALLWAFLDKSALALDIVGVPRETVLIMQGAIVLSDAAGLLGGLLSGLTPLVVLGFLLVPVSYLLLWRTRFGLRLRSCGENSVAAESLGVAVVPHKYVAVVVSGALAGLGGAALVLNPGQLGYLEGQTGGRGYIGLAAMIFGNWRPGGLLAAPLCSAMLTGRSCGRAARPCTRCSTQGPCWVCWWPCCGWRASVGCRRRSRPVRAWPST